MSRNRTSAILLWRPILLFGGGLGLAIFEAIQPLIGHQVEWAIVSLAATMMGLESILRSKEPVGEDPGAGNPAPRDSQAPADRPGNPESRESRDNPAARAVQVALAGLGSRKAPAVAVAAVG